MLNKYTLTGAYGRSYASMDLMIADFKAGKDFKIVETGQYCSIRDFKMLDCFTNVYLACNNSFKNISDFA